VQGGGAQLCALRRRKPRTRVNSQRAAHFPLGERSFVPMKGECAEQWG
jgi:hypothetical protein